MIKVKQLTEVSDDLLAFCDKCNELGYNNNNSLKAMKFEWCQEPYGAYWGVYNNNELVSVAGCHHLPEVSERAYRILFRSAMFPDMNITTGLSKYYFNSLPFSLILPKQIEWLRNNTDADQLVISTNISHDASGHMNRNHRVMQHLAKLGMVTSLGDMHLYYTDQSLWELDVLKYEAAHTNFKKSNSGLFL